MARGRGTIVGRQEELAAANTALNAGSGGRTLLVVRGPAGIGKTALLTALRETWNYSGVDVITMRYRGAVEPWDLFGARAAVSAVREYFDRIGDLQLADAIKQVSQLCTPETYLSEHRRAGLLVALARMFARVARDNRVVLLIDDIDAVPNPALMLASACGAGYLVVATCRDDGGVGTAPWVVGQLADHLIDLAPLPDDRVGALVATHVGGPVDDSVLPALNAALGPLARNPGTLLTTLDGLRREGRLVLVQGRWCIRDSASIALPAEHELVAWVHQLGDTGRDLVAMVASSGVFTMDDLPPFATATGRELAECGRAVDWLITVGVLVCGPSGRLECRCPALANAVLAGMALDSVRHLHRLFVELALRGYVGSGMEGAALADHIALADRALPPTPEVVGLLLAEADRVAPSEPHRAATWYWAALRHAGQEYPGRQTLLPRLLRTLVRGGCYDLLEQVVCELVSDDQSDSPSRYAPETPESSELALAAALAALHTGREVPEAVRGALAGDTGAGPLELANRWFSDAALPALGDFLFEFAALSPQHESPGSADRPLASSLGGGAGSGSAACWDDLAEAAAMGDLITVFDLAFGSAYGKPSTGPLALFHRVARGHATADWSDALSAARRLELTGQPNTPIHWYSRLIATEICSASGQFKQAAKWLAEVPADSAIGGLRGWAEAGLLLSVSGDVAAFTAGWSAYQRAHGSRTRIGWERQLMRLLRIALIAGERDWLESVGAEIDEMHRRVDSRLSREVALLARGLAHGDFESVRAGAELARQRGHLPDQVVACVMVGAVADDPEPWLREAYDVAKYFGLDVHRGWARRLMEERGVSITGPRSPRKAFSDTELRIVELIGAGRTNRQIAVDMQMSVKTVENYLTRLFAKTGCRTRVDLAAASLNGKLTAVGR